MKTTRLSILRQSAVGAPKALHIARKIKTSHQAISLFEGGAQMLGPERLRAYAKAIGASEAQVRRLFLLEAQRYLRDRLAKVGEELKALSRKA